LNAIKEALSTISDARKNFSEKNVKPEKRLDIYNRHFVKLYDSFFDAMKQLSGAELKLLLYLGYLTEYNKTRLILDDEFYDQLSVNLNITKDYIQRLLRALKSKGFVYYTKIYLYIPTKYFSRNRY